MSLPSDDQATGGRPTGGLETGGRNAGDGAIPGGGSTSRARSGGEPASGATAGDGPTAGVPKCAAGLAKTGASKGTKLPRGAADESPRVLVKRLATGPGHFDLARLRSGLVPFRLHWFPRLRSTSDHAAVLRGRGALFAPAVVVAGSQTAGRGRGNNRWWAGPGCLTATFVLPIDQALPPQRLPLLAGLAVRRALVASAPDAEIDLKWPNDLLHRDRKLAGLLCERVNGIDLVGIGLNVNMPLSDAPTPLRHRVTSLQNILSRPVDLTDALLEIARQLLALVVRREAGNFVTLLQEYNRHHALTGRRVRVSDGDSGVEGHCEGLDGEGRLLLATVDGLRRIVAGHVELAPAFTPGRHDRL